MIDEARLIEEIDYYIREAGWGEEANKVLGWCKEFIKSQPKIGGWIPYDFGKNPPKEDGYYWVTLIPNSSCGLKELFERIEKMQRFVRKVEYRNGIWKMIDITVIAWMPYYEPEPYEVKENE